MQYKESESNGLGKAIMDAVQSAVDSHSLTNEEGIAALLINILRLASEHGLDSNKIIELIDTSKFTSPDNNLNIIHK